MATVSAGLAEVAQSKQLEALRQIATQATPKAEIRVRDGRGGQKLKYTDGAYVIRTLNQAFGWDWDFVADSEELLMNGDKPFEVKVRGTLTVRLNGQAVTKTQYGCQPIEMMRDGSKPVSIGDAYKGAATDAMKKCASLLGIALDLYDSDYKPEKYAEPEPVRPVKLEGAQPTNAHTSTATKHILAQIALLQWDNAKVCAWMEEKFNYAIESDDLAGVFDSFGVVEQRKIFAALKAEFEKGGR
jgi:hypothetical protein